MQAASSRDQQLHRRCLDILVNSCASIVCEILQKLLPKRSSNLQDRDSKPALVPFYLKIMWRINDDHCCFSDNPRWPLEGSILRKLVFYQYVQVVMKTIIHHHRLVFDRLDLCVWQDDRVPHALTVPILHFRVGKCWCLRPFATESCNIARKYHRFF